MKRRAGQEREEAEAREQAELRRETLLAELKAREAAGRAPEPAAEEAAESGAAAAEPDDEPPSGELAGVEGREPAVDEPAEPA